MKINSRLNYEDQFKRKLRILGLYKSKIIFYYQIHVSRKGPYFKGHVENTCTVKEKEH